MRSIDATYADEVAAAFDAVAEGYDDHYSTRADLADTLHIVNRARDLYALEAPGLFVDLGCGPGTAIPYLMLPTEQYLGIDLSPGMVAAARKRWAYKGYRFQHGDERSMARLGAAFVFGGFGPLQHALHPAEFADSIRLALRPGGRFLVMGRARMAPTRVLGSDALTWPYSASRVHRAFAAAGLWNLHVYAHRRWVPHWWPVRWQRRALEWEFAREWIDPNLGEWLVIEGRK